MCSSMVRETPVVSRGLQYLKRMMIGNFSRASGFWILCSGSIAAWLLRWSSRKAAFCGPKSYLVRAVSCFATACLSNILKQKLSKGANTSTAINRGETLFLDTMKALVNYAGFLKLEVSVKFVDAWKKDIFHDTSLYDYLPTRNSGTYNLFLRFFKLVIKNNEYLDTWKR